MSASVGQARQSAKLRSRALQREIMDLILERGLRHGDPLPTELELVETFGVGRNTVREALKVLQAMGIVDVRHGYGMFVASTNLDALAVTLEFHARMSLGQGGREATELVDVRQALESELVPSSIDALDADGLAAVASAVAWMDECAKAGRPLAEADRAFHRALYAPLRNSLLSSLLDVFWSAYSGLNRVLPADDAAATVAAHQAIYEAVAARDKEGAAELIRRHFDGARRTLAQLPQAGSAGR